MDKELLTCPWCGEQMRFDADSVHCWYKCDNCFSISPKARRLWDDSKTNKENWDINKAKALFLIERSNTKSSRWVSVEERLPEPGEDCALYVRCGDVSFVRTGWRMKNGQFICPSDLLHGYEVTHWMPLPSAPKEE